MYLSVAQLLQWTHYTIYRDKLYSLGESIKANGEKEFSHAKRFEYILFEVYFEDEINEYNLAIFCEKPLISETYIRKGPPANDKFHVNQFIKKNPDYLEKDGYLYVETKRDYSNFLPFLKNHIQDKIPENLDSINISKSFEVKTSSGKKAIFILENKILPFFNK